MAAQPRGPAESGALQAPVRRAARQRQQGAASASAAPPPPRPAASQRPSSAASGVPSPRLAHNRLEPAAAAQPSHQSSARAAAPSLADGEEAPDAALPPSSQWPALSAGGSAARSAPQPPRKQTASSPLRHPEGNSYAESSQAAAGSSADTTTSELSRASSSSPFPELLGSSPASHGPGRQEQPQDSAQQPPTVHRAPIRLPRPAPQGTPAAFAFPTLAQELLASIFSGPAPNTRRG